MLGKIKAPDIGTTPFGSFFIDITHLKGDIINVKVGSVRHPMLDEHYIQFILLETTDMAQVKYLKPNDEPEATFVLNGKEKPVAVYEYCNLHGLWKYEFNLDLSSRK